MGTNDATREGATAPVAIPWLCAPPGGGAEVS